MRQAGGTSAGGADQALNLPTISLVTPSYNQGQFLEETLQSVLHQNYPRLEYIVIDGHSTDGSADIIRRHASELDYWISEPDRGQADAINKGFARASGDILGWLNSDDVLFPDALKLVGEIFARYPQIAWVTGLGANIDTDSRITRTLPPSGRFASFVKRGWYHGRLLGFIRQEGTFWRRELWEKAGGSLNEGLTYGLDFDLWRRFSAHADLVTIQKPLAGYRQHPAQKTAALDPYYREIGVTLPNWIRIVTLPVRFAFNFCSLPLTPRVIYQPQQAEWRFRPGVFFRPGIS